MQEEHFIATYSNIRFSIENATDEMILPQDIAHALSLVCRANGHFKHFYSVAQHSLNCCREAAARGLEREVQLICLLHDASEAYISDISRPVKECLPQYKMLESNLQNRIYKRFGISAIPNSWVDIVKEIDNTVLLHEFDALHIGGAWAELPSVSAIFDFNFRAMDEVENEFLQTLRELKNDA